MYQIYGILFWNDTLHVTDGLSVHRQEFKTVHTATGICQTDTAVCLLASRHQYLFDKCLLLYVQSWTPDDGRKDRPSHVVCHSKIKYRKFDTLVHLVGFTIEISHPIVLQNWKIIIYIYIYIQSNTTIFIIQFNGNNFRSPDHHQAIITWNLKEVTCNAH